MQLTLALLACAAAHASSAPGCAEGCHLHGTCHAPLGRCDCPRLFAGADCGRRATPSCVVDAASGMDSGCRVVSTCACVLECEAAGFRPLEQGECFNYSAAEPSFDDMLRAPLLEFGSLDGVAKGVANSEASFLRGAWAALDKPRNGWQLLPLADCPSSCNHKGYCRRHEQNGGRPECLCLEDRRGLQGACEPSALVVHHCLGGCSGRGRCLRGFCHCEQGAYGADCSLTGDASEQLYWRAGSAVPAEDAALRPRVYVYTLPPRLNTWYGISQISPNRDFGTLLHERLLSSRYRTADPEQADFFFVPVSPMGTVNHYTAVRAAEWVAAQYPYWARKRGADHIYTFPWDFGACWVGGHPMLNNSVFVTHFGLNARLQEYACACPACAPSYTPGKDVVVPDALNHMEPKVALAAARAERAKRGRAEPERTTLVFFNGGRSGPARQALFDAKLSGPGVRVLENGAVDDAAEMAASVFCIASPGSGFGTRFALAVMAGCIPVSFADAVREPLEDVVDLEAIALRIPQAALPNLVAILRNVSAADVAAKQAQLACVRPHFLWSSAVGSLEGEDGGADAFEALMYALRMRVTPGPHPLLSCATAGRVPGAPKPLRKPCARDECAKGALWPPGGAACGPTNERPC